MLETAVERKFFLFARKLGGRAIKLRNTGRRHDTDRILVLPYGVIVWLELKRPGEKPRSGQRRMHAWLRKRRHKVLVSDGTNLPQAFTFIQDLITIARRRA